MSIRFKQKLRQLFRLINRLSLIEKLLYSLVLVFAVQWILQLLKDFTNWIYQILKSVTDFIFQNPVQISVAIVGIVLFATGSFLFFKQLKNKQSQLNEDLDEEFSEYEYLSDGNTTDQSNSIYTEGNYNESITGDYIEIHGNQININNDFSEIAEQIRELVEQLKNKGYSQEGAEDEIASEFEAKAANNPRVRQTLRRWRKAYSKKNNSASDKQVAQDVVRTATCYSYTSSDDFTDVIGGDFHILNELLAAKKWKEADYETAKILYVVGQEKLPNSCIYKSYPPEYVVEEHIKVIPIKYLKNIDKLWRKHSNGRFGFSVQKRILEKLDEDFYVWLTLEGLEKFGDLVGWRKKDDWLYYVDLYDPSLLKTASSGYFPLAYMLLSDEMERGEVDIHILKVICGRL